MRKILVWGTGRLSRRYLSSGFFSQAKILGFIETKPLKSEFEGYRVYSVNEINEIDYDLILVCVIDDCENIYNTCVENGIALKRVLFVSWKSSISFTEEMKNKLCNEKELKEDFPYIEHEMREKRDQYLYIFNDDVISEELNDSAYICDGDGDSVVVWVPVELLFAEDGDKADVEGRTAEWTAHNRKWSNHPIISFEPYRNLFEFFITGRDYPKLYCDWFQGLFTTRGLTSGYTDELLIEKRYREFRMMQRELNKGTEFFTTHPAMATWNSRGYFNLLDGHHRVSFLYQSGFTRMPIMISRDEYEIWKNYNKANEAHEEICRQERKEFYQPIPNPYYMNLHTYRDEFNKSRLHHLLEYFGPKRMTGKKVVDIGANLGYISQMFYRMGAEVTMIEFDPNHYKLLKIINEMLYVKARVATEAFENYAGKDIFDIAIMLTVFYPYFDEDAHVRDAFIKRLNENVNEMLIWESGNRADEEKAYILENTKFKNYERICYTYATGKFREMGIFTV